MHICRMIVHCTADVKRINLCTFFFLHKPFFSLFSLWKFSLEAGTELIDHMWMLSAKFSRICGDFKWAHSLYGVLVCLECFMIWAATPWLTLWLMHVFLSYHEFWGHMCEYDSIVGWEFYHQTKLVMWIQVWVHADCHEASVGASIYNLPWLLYPETQNLWLICTLIIFSLPLVPEYSLGLLLMQRTRKPDQRWQAMPCY